MHFTISEFVLDLVQNSIEAGARLVELSIDERVDWIEVAVRDDGRGMSDEELERAKHPFYTNGEKHPRRRVGLGIPFLIQALELAGGSYSMASSKGQGTTVSFRFPARGIDTPPTGDLTSLLLSVMCFDGDYELVVARRAETRGVDYTIRRSELMEAAGSLSEAGALMAVQQFLASCEAA